jgi:hypothetical protein
VISLIIYRIAADVNNIDSNYRKIVRLKQIHQLDIGFLSFNLNIGAEEG